MRPNLRCFLPLLAEPHADIIIHPTRRCLSYSTSRNAVVSGSWDKTMCMWDPRTRAHLGVTTLPDKVFTMDTRGDKIIVGTAGRHVWSVIGLFSL